MNRWLTISSLFINYFVFAILLNSVGIVILQVQESYAVTKTAASTLEAFKDLPIAITSFFVASFLVRLGYKRTMLAALAAIGLVCLLMPQVPKFWMTQMLFAATGICFGLVKVSVFASLTLVTRDRREHVSMMSFLEAFFMVGVLSNYFIFSAFIDNQPGSTSWLNVYYVLAALSAFALVLLLRVELNESSLTTETNKPFAEEFAEMLKLAIQPLVLIFIICAFLFVLIEQSFMTWLPTFNKNAWNMTNSLSVQMTSILGAALALGRFAGGIMFRYIDWFKVLAAGLILAAVLLVISLRMSAQMSAQVSGDQVIATWGQAPLAAYLFPLIGLCIAAIYPAINSAVLSALPSRQHAPMAGLIVVFSALGGTTGSMLTGLLFQNYGGQTAFYATLIPIAALIAALYLFKRKTDEIAASRELTPAQ
ncbi:MAG: MFS transporter [Cellvibrionales bacterium]|nr:MFS transporter [Cellvibrionales bacterium]